MRTLITFFLLSTAALAQTAARVDVPLLTTGPNVPSSGGPMPQALWLANATVKVCTHPSSINSCTPAPTFTDSTEATQCPSSAPLTRQPGSICVATTGASATAGFWYLGGLIDFYVTSSYGTTGPYVANAAIANSSLPASAQLLGTTNLAAAQAITLGSNLFLTGTTLNATTGTASNPAGPATACNFANSSVTSFQADLAACAINATSHALTSQILNGVQNAASYQTGGGNNGIANAAISAQNQLTIADPTYSATEQYSFSSLPPNLPPQYHLLDLRQGAQGDFYHSWQQPSASLINFGNNGAAKTTNCLWDGTPLFAGDFETRGIRPETIAESAQGRLSELNPKLESAANASQEPASLLPARTIASSEAQKAVTQNAPRLHNQIEDMGAHLRNRFDTGEPIQENVTPRGCLI